MFRTGLLTAWRGPADAPSSTPGLAGSVLAHVDAETLLQDSAV